MAFSWLLLLPALAGILFFWGIWQGYKRATKFRSSSNKRRIRAKVLIHRALIVTLLLATLVVSRSSLSLLPDIIQGLLVTGVLMIPVLLYIWIIKLMAPVGVTVAAVGTFEQQKFADKQGELPNNSNLVVEHDESPIRLESNAAVSTMRTSDVDVNQPAQIDTSPASSNNAFSNKRLASAIAYHDRLDPAMLTRAVKVAEYHNNALSSKDSESVFDQTLNVDLTLSVEEQMRNLDGLVSHIDIGVEAPAVKLDNHAPSRTITDSTFSKKNATNSTQIDSESESTLLVAMQETMLDAIHGELIKKVVSLQNDKTRLQKLVITQKAVLDNEKQKQKKLYEVTQDAMNVVRRAREGQGIAIKFARQERRKRKRLETDNASMRKQLKNALSTRRIKESIDF